MRKKILLLTVSFFILSAGFAQTSDSTSNKRIRPKDRSFSTYIVVAGLIQYFNIGLENSQYYATGLTNLPIANLKYIYNRKHSFALKLGLNVQSGGSTKTDSFFFKSYITSQKSGHSIPLDISSPGYYEDEVSSNVKNFIFIPSYEYHFKGNKHWDYYIGAEYVLRFSISSKKKNKETIIINNTNNEHMEYTYHLKKSFFLSNHGIVGMMGLNYFVYRWLSIGTKLSYSVQANYLNLNPNDEKLTVNGENKTSTLLIMNSPNTKNYRNVNAGFLNNGYAGILFNFYLWN